MAQPTQVQRDTSRHNLKTRAACDECSMLDQAPSLEHSIIDAVLRDQKAEMYPRETLLFKMCQRRNYMPLLSPKADGPAEETTTNRR